jgi:ankyrin repeat protein
MNNAARSTLNRSLIEAARLGRLQNVRNFIQAGANINARDINGQTALMYAILEDQLQIIRVLIRGGANVNARDKDGYTALMYAIIEDQLQIIRELIRAGANLNARNNDGDTALLVAASWGRVQVVRELLKAGAKNWRMAYNSTNNPAVRNVIKNYASKVITSGMRTATTRRRVAASKIQTAVRRYIYHPNRVQRPNTIVSAAKTRFNSAKRNHSFT